MSANWSVRENGEVWLEGINDERIAKSVYEPGVEGRVGRGRPSRVWMDRVRKALNNRGLT